MSYRELHPAPPLRRHVACFWIMEAPARLAAPTAPHRVLPDGAMDILIWVGEKRLEATVVGTMTSAIVAPDAPLENAVGVRFRPGEAFAFFGIESGALRDATVSPETLGLTGFEALGERIARASRSASGAPPPRAVADVLDAFLLARLAHVRTPEDRVRHAVNLLEATHGALPIVEVARRACVGERQLLRLFDERVGIPPKTLARAFRLQSLCACLDTLTTSPPWARIAVDCVYADQPHMAREVKSLAGVTPSELYRERMSFSYKPAGPEKGQSALLPTLPLSERTFV